MQTKLKYGNETKASFLGLLCHPILRLFYSSQGSHGAWKTKAISVTTVQCNTTRVTTPTKRHQIGSVLHAQAYLSAISCSFTLASSSRSSASLKAWLLSRVLHNFCNQMK